MPPGTSTPPNSAPLRRKRKWKADHVVRISLGDLEDDAPDYEDISTVVVQQASRDGRRFERTHHPVPVPRNPLATVSPLNHFTEDVDFVMEMVGNDGDTVSPDVFECVVSVACPSSFSKLNATLGRTVRYLDEGKGQVSRGTGPAGWEGELSGRSVWCVPCNWSASLPSFSFPSSSLNNALSPRSLVSLCQML